MKPKYKRLLNLISLLGIFLFGCSILFYNLKDILKSDEYKFENGTKPGPQFLTEKV